MYLLIDNFFPVKESFHNDIELNQCGFLSI